MASRSLPRRSAAAVLPDDDSIPLHERVRYRGLLTVAVMGASIMQILDTTIANVAIPHMQSALGATSETVTWVLTSYILASAIAMRSEEHTSELQSLMRISYAVFCLKKKKTKTT